MALVIWNTKYVRPQDRNKSKNVRSNMEYGATREGVQKLEDVEHTQPMSSREGLNYIANRHGVQRFGGEDGDGLFNAGGKADLQAETARLEAHADSTEWRAIISFTKDDLQRVGYDDPETMRQLLAAKMPEIGKQYGISPQNLIWNAAFHPVDKKGRDHHPHYHVYFYSTDPSEGAGKAPAKKVEKARSILTNSIFPEDMSRIQSVGREARAELSAATQKLLADPDWMLTSGMDIRLRELAENLPQTGKKTYAFLPKEVKKQVDDLLRELARQPGMADAYGKMEDAQRQYVEAYNDRPDLIQARMYQWQKHFFHPTGENDRTTLHNQIIRLAAELDNGTPKEEPTIDWEVLAAPPENEPVEEDTLPTDLLEQDIMDAESAALERRIQQMEKLNERWKRGDADAGLWLSRMVRRDEPELADRLLHEAAEKGSRDAYADLAKREKDPQEKRWMLERAAADGDPQALYQLGKFEEKTDLTKAIMWYEKAANQNIWATLRLAALYADTELLDGDLFDPERAAKMRLEAHFMLDGDEWRSKLTESEQRNLNRAQHRLGYLYQQAGQISDAVIEYGTVANQPTSKEDDSPLAAARSLVRIYHHTGWMATLEQQESPKFVDETKKMMADFEAQMHPWMGFSAEYRTARKMLAEGDPAAVELLIAEAGTQNALANIDLGAVYEAGELVEVNEDAAYQHYATAISQLGSAIRTDILIYKRYNPYAEFCLGTLHLNGKGCEVNVKVGMEYYNVASRHGSAMASLALARIYERGELVQKDTQNAYTYYQTAIGQLRGIIQTAEKDEEREPDGQTEYRLGRLLMDGKGCDANLEEAEQWFQRALDHGEEQAAYALGKLSEKREQYAEAIRWYEMASKNNVWACLRLATLYTDHDLCDGALVNEERAAEQREQAHKLLDAARGQKDSGFAFAWYRLGYLYQEQGQISDAVKAYSEAAMQENDNDIRVDAARSLVRIHHHTGWMQLLKQQETSEFVESAKQMMEALETQMYPWIGFSAEYRTARKMLAEGDPAAVELLVAEAGTQNALANIDLGVVYEAGELVDTNEEIAHQHYVTAISQLKSIINTAVIDKRNDPYAEFRLGTLLLNGKGCEVNVKGGMTYYNAASQHGSATASIALAQIYERGELVSEDTEKADEYYKTAINQLRANIQNAHDEDRVDGWSEYRLGQLLMDGKGCDANLEEAEQWFQRALDHGEEQAKAGLVQLYVDADAVKEAAGQVRGTAVLQRTTLAEQSGNIQQMVKSLAEPLSSAVPEDLQEALKETVENHLLEYVYRHHVATVISGIYQSVSAQREEYRALAGNITCSAATVEDISSVAREQINRLLPEAAGRADEAAREKMVRAVLQIATRERITQLLENDHSLRRAVVKDTVDLRYAMHVYGCTRYGDELPEPVREKLNQTAAQIATRHPEFAEAASADPDQWQRQVWNMAREQMYAQQRIHHFSRGNMAMMFIIASDIGRMTAQMGRQNQQENRDPQQKKSKKQRKDRHDQNTQEQQEDRSEMDVLSP